MTITTILHLKKYPKKINQLFRRKRWSNGVICVRCHSRSLSVHQKLRNGIYRYRCRNCRRMFSDLTSTIFEGTKISLWKWMYTLFEFLSKSGVNSIALSEKLDVNQKTAWRMLMVIRKSLNSKESLLKGIVEGDESYFGGRQKGKKGRSIRYSNKTCVAGVIERKGKVAIKILQRVDEETLTKFVETNVAEDTKVYTDGYGGYCGLNYAGFIHDSVDHNREFVKGEVHTQTIEGFWSFLKRKLRGVYYRPSAAYLLQYLKEYVFRYNHRGLSAEKRFSSLLSFALNIS